MKSQFDNSDNCLGLSSRTHTYVQNTAWRSHSDHNVSVKQKKPGKLKVNGWKWTPIH